MTDTAKNITALDFVNKAANDLDFGNRLSAVLDPAITGANTEHPSSAALPAQGTADPMEAFLSSVSLTHAQVEQLDSQLQAMPTRAANEAFHEEPSNVEPESTKVSAKSPEADKGRG